MKSVLPLRAFITREEAEGTTATWACRFWMVSCTVTRRPFHAEVALAISSPTFFGDYINDFVFVRCFRMRVDYTTYQTQGTDLWCERGGGTDLTSSSTEVDDFDFIGILVAFRCIEPQATTNNTTHEFWCHLVV
jgi:hypothetical protein